ncbi:unnamed protein product [Pieris macdunnoughi]|uniref:Nuclease HARBI1 n=1 Tax=Pieris macdunnoughi TaxID=345717 RepID=A0A821MQU2_9NEOP|nr:unnamed protein product [Pieris macdunnoughi]
MSPEEVVMLSAAYIIIHKSVNQKKKEEKNFTRMSPTDFEMLLRLIGPSIKKNETKFRHPIEPQRRLLVTLRFLATGDSYGSLSYSFKISKQLISKIIPEVCKELNNVLKDYVKWGARQHVS